MSADFRSDAVTKPSAAMRDAMATAEVGDDVLEGDPTVARLEARAAEWLGKEGALFVPSGTMANQVAVGVWTEGGGEVIAERDSHVVAWEGAAIGRLHGCQTVTLSSDGGAMDPDEVRAAIREPGPEFPRTRLLCMEQTHMGSGGRVVPLENVRTVSGIARDAGVPVHLDGARLANAVVASGVAAAEWAASADSVSFCLSKGLGAPVGSIVAGDGDFRQRGWAMRKLLGGGMRQSGILAAAGLIALESGLERLAEDHALAQSLAAAIDAIDGLSCPPEGVETNLVQVTVEHPDHDAAGLCRALEDQGVLALPDGERLVRLVTHVGVGEDDVQRAVDALAVILD